MQVAKIGDKAKSYEDFCNEFPAGECRYGVFDVEYTDPKTGGQRNKIVFYSWLVRCARICLREYKLGVSALKDTIGSSLYGYSLHSAFA